MPLRLPFGAAVALTFALILSACTEVDAVVVPITTVVTVPIASVTPAKPGTATPKPGVAVSEPVKPEPGKLEPAKPEPAKPEPARPTPGSQQPPTKAVEPTPVNPVPVNPAPVNPTPVNPAPVNPTPANPSSPTRATDVYLNHYCLLSDHSNLCSRTTMHQDWPGHSLKLEPINNSGKTLTGTLVIEYDASKIEPAADGNLRHSVRHSTIRFEKSPGKLIIKNFVIRPGQDYQYLWNRIKPNASGTVIGKATFSWQQDKQIKYVMGCYEFKIGSQGGNDNIQGLEKRKFNGYSGMDCGAPSIPD
jgi:hypothetical protein